MHLPRVPFRAAILLGLFGLSLGGCANDCRRPGWHRGDERHGDRYHCGRHDRRDHRY
jgi:hypothetical protein